MLLTIISAALGGFCGWILIRCVSFLVLRNRLKRYLEATLTLHLSNLRDIENWLHQVMQETIRVGSVVERAPYYTRDALESVTCVRERCLELLTKREMVRLTKCIHTLWEAEVLFEGFCLSLREKQEKGAKLDIDTVAHFKKRAMRIQALLNVLPGGVKSFADLPDDYAGKISAATLVMPVHMEISDQSLQ